MNISLVTQGLRLAFNFYRNEPLLIMYCFVSLVVFYANAFGIDCYW